MAKPHIPVSLIAVDTGSRVDLSVWALDQCCKRSTFDSVKLLTHERTQPYAVEIPRFEGVQGYSNFVVRHLHEYFDTSHCLIVQWDGFILNPYAWQPRFLNFDYIGAAYGNWVGIGGFSLRSKRFMQIASRFRANENAHPEDNFLSLKYRSEFEKGHHIRYAPNEVANGFTIESRTYNGRTNVWSGTPKFWAGEFGFHSYLTPIHQFKDRPKIFHHSGDFGDIIYALPTIQALGGGMLYVSPQVSPMKVRSSPTQASTNSIADLLQHQPCIWSTVFTEVRPHSVDYDLNQFRRCYMEHRTDKNMSLVELVARNFGVDATGHEPWLRLPEKPWDYSLKPIVIARSERYHNDAFPWRKLVDQHGADMLFVGTPKEHQWFTQQFGAVEYRPTKTLLDLAYVIQQAKVCCMNQSAPNAIALALGKNTITEAWLINANTNLHRDNQIHWLKGPLEIPKEWL